MAENVVTISVQAPNVTRTGSVTTEQTALTYTLTGGNLSTLNSIRITAQCKVTFNTVTAVLTVRVKYGTTVVAATTFGTSGTVPATDLALVLLANLSANNNTNIQVLHSSGAVNLVSAQQLGSPVNFGSGTEASGSDKDIVISFQWNEASSSHAVTLQHVVFEKLTSPVPVAAAGVSAAPVTQMLMVSKLNRLPVALYARVVFYADLLHHLDFKGVGKGPASFTRGSTSTALWRDGAPHALAVNVPRFEYSGDIPQGLKLTSSTETLSYGSANAGVLSTNGNTLMWMQGGVVKIAPSPDSKPFNSSGVWTASVTNVYIAHIIGFDSALSTAEKNLVSTILTTTDPV